MRSSVFSTADDEKQICHMLFMYCCITELSHQTRKYSQDLHHIRTAVEYQCLTELGLTLAPPPSPLLLLLLLLWFLPLHPSSIRWPSFRTSDHLSQPASSLQISSQSAGQLSLLQKFSLLRLTAIMEKYSMSNKHGWTWLVHQLFSSSHLRSHSLSQIIVSDVNFVLSVLQSS